MKTLLNKIRNFFIGVFTYMALIIDRIVLIPFPFVSSYSIKELLKKPDRFAGFVVYRVAFAIIVLLIIILIKIIF